MVLVIQEPSGLPRLKPKNPLSLTSQAQSPWMGCATGACFDFGAQAARHEQRQQRQRQE
jgi:hypothetical protein